MKIKARFLFIFSALLAISGNLASEELPARPLTMTELVDIALQNNPSTKQAWWNARRAAAALGAVLHFVPHPRPLLAPREGAAAAGAGLGGQGGFGVGHHRSSFS